MLLRYVGYKVCSNASEEHAASVFRVTELGSGGGCQISSFQSLHRPPEPSSVTWKMEAACFSETSQKICDPTGCSKS